MRKQTVKKPVPKERVRGPNLRVLIKRDNGVPFERALPLVDKEGLVIASNRSMDRALQAYYWKQEYRGQFYWTGTMTGYVEPDKKLGTYIEYTDPDTNLTWVFPVPKQYQGEKNAILVAEHPDYTLEADGKRRIVTVPEYKVGIVLRFPTKSSWCLVDTNHGIPTIRPRNKLVDFERYLWRLEEKRVGPVVRSTGPLYGTRYVFLSYIPSNGFGVVVEANPEVQSTLGASERSSLDEAGAPTVETASTPSKIQITEQSGKLIIEETREQLAKVKEAVEKLEN